MATKKNTTTKTCQSNTALKNIYWVQRAFWNRDDTDITGFEYSPLYDNQEEATEAYSNILKSTREDISLEERIEVTLFVAETNEEDPTLDDLQCSQEEIKSEYILPEYKSVEGALLVGWYWDRYLGYARKLEELRFGYYGETEEMTIDCEATFRRNWSVLATAEELEGLTEEEKRELAEDRLHDNKWKWNAKSHIQFWLDYVFPEPDEEDEDGE